MSLTDEAYQERKWQGLNRLRSALADEKLDDRYYGWSSVSSNVFERMHNLLEIGLLVSDNFERLPAESEHEIYALSGEMMGLARMLRDASETFSDLGDKIAKDAQAWCDKSKTNLR